MHRGAGASVKVSPAAGPATRAAGNVAVGVAALLVSSQMLSCLGIMHLTVAVPLGQTQVGQGSAGPSSSRWHKPLLWMPGVG
jgi:hypothetical protein